VHQAIYDKKMPKFQLQLGILDSAGADVTSAPGAVAGINLYFAPQAKYIGRALIGTTSGGIPTARVNDRDTDPDLSSSS
jgi:hypothetical protein